MGIAECLDFILQSADEAEAAGFIDQARQWRQAVQNVKAEMEEYQQQVEAWRQKQLSP